MAGRSDPAPDAASATAAATQERPQPLSGVPLSASGLSASPPLVVPESERVLPSKAVCIWCGTKVTYASDDQAREHFAFCTADCKQKFYAVLEEDPDHELVGSGRHEAVTE